MIIYGKDGIIRMAKNNSEDWLQIKSINNGHIILDDGSMVTGVKIEPKNIFILDQSVQANVIMELTNFYNTIDYEFWLISAGRPVDINLYLASLQVHYNNTTSQQVRKLLIQDINKANDFMSTQANVVDTEYFILFKEKKPEVIQKRIQGLISGLARCTLNSKQVSNDDLRMILDNFFNGAEGFRFGAVTSV